MLTDQGRSLNERCPYNEINISLLYAISILHVRKWDTCKSYIFLQFKLSIMILFLQITDKWKLYRKTKKYPFLSLFLSNVCYFCQISITVWSLLNIKYIFFLNCIRFFFHRQFFCLSFKLLLPLCASLICRHYSSCCPFI